FPLKIIRTEEKGDVPSSKKKLIERAINIAAGELILTTDADVRHAPGWIRSFIELYESGETSMILGPVAYAGEKGCLGKFQSLEMISLMGVTAGSCRMGFPLMCNGANLAYKKEAFLECGGYKGNQQFVSGDDMFLLMRIIKKYGRKSVKFLLSPVAVVSTKPQLTLRNFFSQRFRWVSKSRGYTDFRIIFTALSTYFFNLAMLSGFVIGIWNLPVLWTTLILVVTRMLLEGPLVMLMAKFLGKEKLISLFPPMDLLYIPYVVITGFLGMILPYQWKGRRVIRGGVVKGELKQSPDPPAV
ncbi:MAG: glycosyltransferase family 2 protein, partial [Bacteroidota bacterium]|nr:glycosyltransferase family 2 protein [Bacteroidota bacterium]